MFSDMGMAYTIRVLLILMACRGIDAIIPTPPIESGSSSSSSATKVSTSSITTSASSLSGLITPAPVYTSYTYTGVWDNQSIVLNTCSFTANQGNIEWEPCSVQVGSIKLSYFPEASGNTTYPMTHYVSEWDITMTSPSIYMLLNTVTGFNDCGALGPTFKNKVISMDITDVSTLPPYADATTHDRISTQERQITLSDLLDCPSYTSHPSGASTNDHPVSDTYNRCNPFIKLPEQASAIGYPFWRHCAPVSYRMGVWDPPGAVPTVSGLFPTTVDVPYTSTPDPASVATSVERLPASTAIVEATPTPTPSPVEATPSSVPAQIPASSPLPDTPSPSTTPAVVTFATSTPVQQPAATPSATPVTVPIATIGGETVSAAPGASTVQIGSQTLTAGGAEVTLSGGSVATLGGGGSLLVKGPSGSTSIIVIPTAEPIAIELKAASWIRGFGSSAMAVGTQTASIGGPALTLSNHDVVSLGPSGLNVQMPGGAVSTFLPSANVAVLIASMVGATSVTTSAVSSSSTSSPSSSTTAAGPPSSSAALSSRGSASNVTAGPSKSPAPSASLSLSATAGPSSSRATSSPSSGVSSASIPSSSGSNVATNILPISTGVVKVATNSTAASFTGAGARKEADLRIWGVVVLAVGLGLTL